MKKMFKLIPCLFLFQMGIFASEAEIKSIQLKTIKGVKSLNIAFNKNYLEFPSLRFDQNKLDLIIPSSKMSYQLNDLYSLIKHQGVKKKVKVSSKQINNQTVLSLIFGQSTKVKDNDIQVSLKDQSIDLVFSKPFLNRVTSYSTNSVQAKKEVANNEDKKEPVKKVVSTNKLDETFLNSLIAETKTKKVDPLQEKTDQVKEKKSSLFKGKENSSQFNISNYIGKIAAFIGIVLLFFYGIILVFKKGFIKKSKMSFLKNGASIQILNTTYVSPKKSLMLIKVNNQVFLVGNSDQGMSLISEINDTVSTLKSTEKEIIGSNFDDQVQEKSKNDKEFKMKENIYESNEGALREFLKRRSKTDEVNSVDRVELSAAAPEKKQFSKGFKEKLSKLKPIGQNS